MDRGGGQVESPVVEIRDDAGDVVASTVTGPSAALSSGVLCRAKTRFETRLPRRHSYTFDVRGLPGPAEPISFEDLKALGFECPLTIVVSSDLTQFSDLSCTPTWYELRTPASSHDLR